MSLEKHACRFAEAMTPTHDVKLHVVPLRGHCDPSAEANHEYVKTILRVFE